MPIFLEELHLRLFRGFTDFRLACSQVTVLVGPNSCGKTTILQAVKFLHDILADCIDKIISCPAQPAAWSKDPQAAIHRLNPSDPDAFWPKKSNDEHSSIVARFSNGLSVTVTTQPSRYDVRVQVGDIPLHELPEAERDTALLRELKEFVPTMVPPPEAASATETKRDHPSFSKGVSAGQAPHLWRNTLYWLYNDGQKERYDEVAEFVKRYLDGTRVLPPRETHHQPALVEIQFEEDGIAYDIGAGGGGLHALLNLGVVLTLSETSCLLLDEPDAHLHSHLQREVAKMLLDHAERDQVQVIVSTHAPDFISEIPADSLVWIDRSRREGTMCDEHSQVLVNLGAISLDMLASANSHQVLFVEGQLDRCCLSSLFDLTRYRNPFTDTEIAKTKLPDGKGNMKHLHLALGALREIDPSSKMACIVDRDYEVGQEVERKNDDPLVVTLERKEIENYLLDPQALAAAAQADADRRIPYSKMPVTTPSVSELKKQLYAIVVEEVNRGPFRSQYKAACGRELPVKTDDSQRYEHADNAFAQLASSPELQLRHCPGKKVFRRIRTWCQDTYKLHISTDEVVKHLAECPKDISEAAERIERYFYGSDGKAVSA